MNVGVYACMCVCVRCMKSFACSTTAFFGRQLSSSRPSGDGGEGRGGGRRREPVCLDLLSSVAVVGQGRPGLGDAHYQFFCGSGARQRQSEPRDGLSRIYIICGSFFTINVEATQGLEDQLMWYKYGWLLDSAITTTRGPTVINTEDEMITFYSKLN